MEYSCEWCSILFNESEAECGIRFCSRSCRTCFSNWKRYGGDTSVEDKFWKKVDKTPGFGPNGDCWKWTGSLNSNRTDYKRYGILDHKKKTYLAHRLSYEIYNKLSIINTSIFACHSCDTPKCVNPEHIFLGSHSDNMKDMGKKGRAYAAKGEKNSKAKLSSDNVLSIVEKSKTLNCTRVSLGIEFGVVPETIGSIINGKLWSHLTKIKYKKNPG